MVIIYRISWPDRQCKHHILLTSWLDVYATGEYICKKGQLLTKISSLYVCMANIKLV